MKKLFIAACSLVTLMGVNVAAADAWPSKTIRLVVPYAPGGYTDAVGRITARYLEKALGQNVIVENRAGAGGIIGTDLVAKSAGDGYTFCVCSIGAVSVAPVAQKVQYDPLKDFKAVSPVSTIPQTVIANAAFPAKSMKELVDYAKANPGKVTYASSGAGGLMHFSVQLFQARTGTKLTHVPFKGGAPATAAVVSGEVNITFTNLTDALPQIEAKRVTGLAVTSTARNEFAKDLPTVSETVVPGFDAVSWNGVLAPASTPDDIIAKLSTALKAMSEDPEVKKSMGLVGASTAFQTPADYTASIAAEVNQWTALLKEISEQKS